MVFALYKSMEKWLVFFVTGSILGSIGDYFHKVFHITIYPSQLSAHQIPGMPVWTIFLFGFGTLTMALGYQFFRRFRKHLKFKMRTSVSHAASGAVVFLGIYALSACIGNFRGPLPDVTLAIMSLVFWVVFDGTVGGLLFALAVGLVGTAVEITLVHFGMFSYGPNTSKLLGVASWLPWIYLAAAVAVSDFSVALKYKKRVV